jgi:hypothetical protein
MNHDQSMVTLDYNKTMTHRLCGFLAEQKLSLPIAKPHDPINYPIIIFSFFIIETAKF